jgi:hypothetical protein
MRTRFVISAFSALAWFGSAPAQPDPSGIDFVTIGAAGTGGTTRTTRTAT